MELVVLILMVVEFNIQMKMIEVGGIKLVVVEKVIKIPIHLK